MSESLMLTSPRHDQLPGVCRLLFSALAEPERTARRTAAVEWFGSDAFDTTELLIAQDMTQEEERVVGAGFVHQEPGRQASIWVPVAIAGPRRDAIIVALAEAYRARFLAQGTQVAQLLLPETGPNCPPALEQIGFRFVTHMEYLARRLTLSDRTATIGEDYQLLPVDSVQAVGTLLVATYKDSLDIPELNDTRTVDEIVLGYTTPAHQPPARWYRIDHGRQPVGVLMLNPGDQLKMIDLGYLGLVPSARGRGAGKQVVAGVIGMAARMGMEWLTVSSDERNIPAGKVYRQSRFGILTRQRVYLWKPPSQVPCNVIPR
ncbi:MAG: GNAT family N-acetyltransferase [Bacteroidales bacterium]|nr:GNAT family N-acetyltransferase [Bacteroidales bacterium]